MPRPDTLPVVTGWRHPDHNTPWRFYQRHHLGMRELFKRTERTVVSLELVAPRGAGHGRKEGGRQRVGRADLHWKAVEPTVGLGG